MSSRIYQKRAPEARPNISIPISLGTEEPSWALPIAASQAGAVLHRSLRPDSQKQ